jgi:hypothetical protein
MTPGGTDAGGRWKSSDREDIGIRAFEPASDVPQLRREEILAGLKAHFERVAAERGLALIHPAKLWPESVENTRLRNCYEITLPLQNVLGYSGVDG